VLLTVPYLGFGLAELTGPDARSVCQDTEVSETTDAQMQTQGDLLNQQKLLRSTEQRRRRPTARPRSDCSVVSLSHRCSITSEF